MTYKPEYEVGPKSPGVWQEVRRLEAENERLRKEQDELDQQGEYVTRDRDAWRETAYENDRARQDAEAENEGLRARPEWYNVHEFDRLRRIEEAMKDIVRFADEVPHGFELHDLVSMARAALADQPTRGDVMEREPFDIVDYKQRLRDRTDDHELLVDGARVAMELTHLRDENERLRGDVEHLQDALAIVNASDVLRLRRIEEAARETKNWIYGGDCYKHLPDDVTKRLRAALADQPTEPDFPDAPWDKPPYAINDQPTEEKS